MDLIDIGHAVRAWRTGLGLSQMQLAHLSDLSRQAPAAHLIRLLDEAPVPVVAVENAALRAHMCRHCRARIVVKLTKSLSEHSPSPRA